MKRKFKTPALVLGSGKTALALIRSLGSMSIPVVSITYCSKEVCSASRYARYNYVAPDPAENPQGFLSFLEKTAAKFKGGVLFPADSFAYSLISHHKNQLSEFFNSITPDWINIQKIIKNNLYYDASDKTGIAAPRILLADNTDQALWFGSETGYPVLVKADYEHDLKDIFKRDIILARNDNHLRNYFEIAVKSNRKVILQEYIPTDKVSGAIYMAYFHKGCPVLEFSAQSLRVSHHSGIIPRVLMSKYIPDIFDPSRKLLNTLKVEGYTSLEYIRDERNGIYKLLKITPGFSEAVQLAVKCGINFPYHTYIYKTKGILPEESGHFKEKVYWIDPVPDIINVLRLSKYEKINLKDFLNPYLHRKVFTVPSIRDPLPLLRNISNYFKAVPGQLFELMIRKRLQQT